MERTRQEQRLLAVESNFRGRSAATGPSSSTSAMTKAVVYANGWQIAVASETVLAYWSQCIKNQTIAHDKHSELVGLASAVSSPERQRAFVDCSGGECHFADALAKPLVGRLSKSVVAGSA